MKRGHSLHSTCSHLAPNLVIKNAGNRHSWEFQNFPEEHLLGPQWLIQGGRGLGACACPFFGFFFFFFTKTKFTSKKLYIVLIKQVRNLSQNAGNGHFRDSHIQSENFWGCMPPDFSRKLALSALLVPLLL